MNIVFLLLSMAFLPEKQKIPPVKVHIEIRGQDTNRVSIESPNQILYYKSVFDGVTDVSGKRKFDFKLPFTQATFAQFTINKEFYVSLAFAPGDSVSLIVTRSIEGGKPRYALSIEGSNSRMHAIYYNRFYPPGRNFQPFTKLVKDKVSPEEYYTKSKTYIDNLTIVWDSLSNTGIDVPPVLQLYKADTRASLYAAALRKLPMKDTSAEAKQTNRKLRDLFFFHGDASNKLLTKTPFGIRALEEYLSAIVREDVSITDTLLKKSDMSYYYYIDPEIREDSWGSELYSNRILFPTMISQVDSVDLAIFERYYPQSKYLAKINSIQEKMINERKSLRHEVVIDDKEYPELNKIFASLNGDYFFIDAWATWCMPCIQEFKYYTTMSKFLDKKNVKEVFFSVDRKEDISKWKSYVKTQYVAGYHFRLTEKNQKELLQIIGDKNEALSIPRYLFYDKKNNKYHVELPRPSSGVVLESKINEIITQSEIK